MAPETQRGRRPEDRQAREAWALARRQHGLIARRQLLALGFSQDAIKHRLASGRLHRVRRGVYAVGRPTITGHGRWAAAVLAGGEEAVLSHSSAAALWRIGSERAELIELSVRSPHHRRGLGLRIHRRPSLRSEDVAVHHGIPVTGVVQTLIDITPRLSRRGVERAINEADKYDLVHPPELRQALEPRRGEPGVPRLRWILDRRTFRLTRDELERLFLPIPRRLGMPAPLTGQIVNGFEVDFFWPHLGLVVETDGLRFHRTPAEQARDRLRDQAHTAAGLANLRFTHEQVKYERELDERILGATFRRLASAAHGGPPREPSPGAA